MKAARRYGADVRAHGQRVDARARRRGAGRRPPSSVLLVAYLAEVAGDLAALEPPVLSVADVELVAPAQAPAAELCRRRRVDRCDGGADRVLEQLAR